MRLSDFVVDYLAKKHNVEVVFTVTGGGAMYLNDAFGSHPDVKYIGLHHEQSASMACEAYARLSGKISVCQLTTGPGGTNAISGCAGAWIDSTPIIFISGQVESYTIATAPVRQFGVQEVNILDLVSPITKAVASLREPDQICYQLDRLIHIAKSGRPGPVWLDIPLDIQNANIDESKLPKFVPSSSPDQRAQKMKLRKFQKILGLLKKARRPIICVGNGCRQNAT